MSWALYALLAVPLGAALLTLLDGWILARAATLVAGVCVLALTIAIAISVEHGRRRLAARRLAQRRLPAADGTPVRDGGCLLGRLPRCRAGA